MTTYIAVQCTCCGGVTDWAEQGLQGYGGKPKTKPRCDRCRMECNPRKPCHPSA